MSEPMGADGDLETAVEGGVPLRATSDAARANDWALVLASGGIPHRVRTNSGQWVLEVDPEVATVARKALDAFDAEAEVSEPPALPEHGSGVLGMAAAILLLAFYVVTGGRDGAEPSGWFRVGSASSALIVEGQWWRAVTALTLHADLMHLAGNVIACLIFVAAVGRWIGSGLTAWLTLLAGAAGNALTAWVHREAHVSVGASTATFAALGLLAGLQVVRRVRVGPLRRRAWIPIGAGLALFAMLGVGERSDVLAHLFGLAVGCVLGVITALPFRRPWPRLVQGALSLGALGALAGCWLLAWG